MEYLRATGAWMNEINRHIDDVVVKAGVSLRGGWREVLWSNFVFPLKEEDGLVLDEVNRQRRAHAAASSSPVEAP